MTQKNNFTFPRIENLELIKKCYADINGSQSFLPVKNWQTDVWTAEVQCSCGTVLKKAGLAVVEMTGGRVEGAAADMTLLQTLAWPVNPCIPGLIIMASTGKIEDQNVMVTVYIDLIIQNGAPNQNDKDMLASALKMVCDRHGQSLDEYQSFLAGRGMLGGCAAECGILYFFEESDAALLEEMMQEALKVYQQIINGNAGTTSAADDFVKMQDARKKIVEWMLTEDYGVKVARQNNIPVEVMEAYGFPPPQHS
jgi:hypothetical protein